MYNPPPPQKKKTTAGGLEPPGKYSRGPNRWVLGFLSIIMEYYTPKPYFKYYGISFAGQMSALLVRLAVADSLALAPISSCG